MNLVVLVTALLGFIGLSIQSYFSITRKLEQGFSVLYATNHFFSFFTIIINTSVAVLLFGYYFFPQSKLSRWFRKSVNSAAVALYILIVSLIYYTLLRNNRPLLPIEMVATHILHGYVPLVYLCLWFFKFRNGDLKYADSIKWVLFPLGYFVYILIRGAMIDAYPYFFVNVAEIGYSMVLVYAACILAVFSIIGLSLVMVDRKIKLNKK